MPGTQCRDRLTLLDLPMILAMSKAGKSNVLTVFRSTFGPQTELIGTIIYARVSSVLSTTGEQLIRGFVLLQRSVASSCYNSVRNDGG